jgi:hypothetical protein
MRWLALAELIVLACISAVLLTSATTFAYYRFGWLVHIGIALVVALLARRQAYWLLMGLSALTMPFALLMLPPHFGALDLFLILWTLVALPLISAGLIGRQIAARTIHLPYALLIIVIAAGCVISLRAIREFPNFSATDEAMIYNYIDTFERTGKIEASLIPYPASVVTGNLYVYAGALWTTIFHEDPFALRNFSAVGGLLLIVVVFATGRALHNTLTGGIAAALLATNLLWMAVAHVGRQEIWLAVLVWTAMWLSLEARKRNSRWIAVLAGITVGLSADVHPLGALACIALGGWWIAEWWQIHKGGCAKLRFAETRPSTRLVSAFVIGGLIGTAYYVGVHILPDPGYFLAGIRDELVSYGAEGSTPLGAMIARHISYLQANPLEVGLLVICALGALRQRTGRRLGVFIGGLMLLYALTVADPNLYYPIVWITGMVILAAVGFQTVAWNWRAPLLVAFLAAFVLNVVLVERHVRAGWNERAVTAIEQVAARLPDDKRGTGESFLYLVRRDPLFIGFTFVNIEANDEPERRWEIIERLKPDWIVTMRDESLFRPPFGILSVDVPHMHLQIADAALRQQYYLSETIATSVGDFEIWRRS